MKSLPSTTNGIDPGYRTWIHGPVIRILSIVGALIAVVLSVSFFWIARLRKEIRRRKQIQLDLEKAKREADEANTVIA